MRKIIAVSFAILLGLLFVSSAILIRVVENPITTTETSYRTTVTSNVTQSVNVTRTTVSTIYTSGNYNACSKIWNNIQSDRGKLVSDLYRENNGDGQNGNPLVSDDTIAGDEYLLSADISMWNVSGCVSSK